MLTSSSINCLVGWNGLLCNIYHSNINNPTLQTIPRDRIAEILRTNVQMSRKSMKSTKR